MNKGARDWAPTIYVYVVEYENGRLALHTFEEAAKFVEEQTNVEAELEKQGPGYWRAEEEVLDFWAEVKKVHISQPRRLLRDDDE